MNGKQTSQSQDRIWVVYVTLYVKNGEHHTKVGQFQDTVNAMNVENLVA